MRRLDRALVTQLVSFAAIGIASTAAYAILYLVIRTGAGPQAANALALLITSVGNTLANRRLTFGVRGSGGLVGDLAAGMIALALALLITSASVTVLGAVSPDADRMTEIAVLTGANVAATLARFLVLRAWIGARSTVVPRRLATEQVPR